MENYAGLMQAKKGNMVLAEALIDAIGKWEDLNEEERAAK